MVDGSYHMVTLDYTVFPDNYVEGQEADDKSLRLFSYFPVPLDFDYLGAKTFAFLGFFAKIHSFKIHYS